MAEVNKKNMPRTLYAAFGVFLLINTYKFFKDEFRTLGFIIEAVGLQQMNRALPTKIYF